MAVMRNSRTDWRWRVARDLGSRASNQWLLTSPNENTTSGRQEFPAFFPAAYKRANNYRVAINAQSGVTGMNINQMLAEVPFSQSDWPVPRGYRRSRELLTWLQTRRPIYDDQEVQPFNQTDWPVPKGRPFPLENRGFVQGSPRFLIEPPFAQYDWPNPTGYAYARRHGIANRGFVQGTPALLLAIPFHQTEWPNPWGYNQSGRSRFWQAPRTIYIPPFQPDVEVVARYAPGWDASARYTARPEFEARYGVPTVAEARYADGPDLEARYGTPTQMPARYAPQTDSEART